MSSTFQKLLYPLLGKLFSAIANPKLCDRCKNYPILSLVPTEVAESVGKNSSKAFSA
ncbi:MAG: hypothetical protein F6J90_36615 [Moorea sp. SIOASIH]|uniref:hypothetical protein n=1 Tax=Moorena sp. SIOASIH TaxID=2607817 RepID=UPI0013B5D18C|nr:hypothetical protein [Moorena sp. SIOASIH]NEO41559.1 hypothetical protein [Moorena sp. SIOASIH]